MTPEKKTQGPPVFASTRAQLWQLIDAWARRLSQLQPR